MRNEKREDVVVGKVSMRGKKEVSKDIVKNKTLK